MTSSALGFRDRKKLATRRAIRRAALALFEANGYAATSVEQIAAAADVAPMTVYRYFATKENTVVSVWLTPEMREVLETLADELALGGPDVTTSLARSLDTLARLEDEGWVDSLASRAALISATPELTRALWAQSTAWTDALVTYLPTDGFAARVQARAIIGALLEAILAWPQTRGFPSIDSLTATVERALTATRCMAGVLGPADATA